MTKLKDLFKECESKEFKHDSSLMNDKKGPPINHKPSECSRCRLEAAIDQVGKQQVRVGVAVFVWRRGQLLLHKRKGDHGGGTWSIPGGHQEYGENPKKAAVRELTEECGPMMVCTEPRIYTPCPFVNNVFDTGKHYLTLYFECMLLSGGPELMEPDKNEGWSWFDPDNLPTPLFDPLDRLYRLIGSNVYSMLAAE